MSESASLVEGSAGARGARRSVWPVALFAILLATSACAPMRAMCRAESECGLASACVAGRCQASKKGEVAAKARIQSARRLRVAPRKIVCANGPDRVATCAARESLDLGFSVELRPEDEVVEAYLNMCLVDPPYGDLMGHAEDSPQLSRAGSTPSRFGLPSEDIGLARTRLKVGDAGCPVRLDVLELIRKWRTRVGAAGTARVVWEGAAVDGTQVALQSLEPAGDVSLELYVR